MKNFLRRDFLKGLVSIPLLGYFSYGFKNNILLEQAKKKTNFLSDLGIDHLDALRYKLRVSNAENSKPIRIGLAGYGWRGTEVLQCIGFAHPSWIKENTKDGKYNDAVLTFLEQEDLNLEFTAVCDAFSVRAMAATEISQNEVYPGKKKGKRNPVKIFATYSEMIASKEIDAVIICTPDHLHATMAAEAAKAGIHVYLEKPMTRTIEEAKELRDIVKSSKIVFQLGHQNRQQRSYEIAKELVTKKVLGDISMVETFTNRNSDFGAWIRGIDKRGTLNTINWKEFLGNSPWQEFNPDKYFNWQRFYEFGSGAAGTLFTHYYDCINQVLGLGIPEHVAALGGTYYYKDARDIPDVLNCIFNYPKRGLSLTYDSTLKNSKFRPITLLGTDATMEIANTLNVYKDSESEKYKKNEIDPSKTMYSYFPDPRVDALTSATALTYIKSGLGQTMIENKIIDTTVLHMKEWIDAIRGLGSTSCNIDMGFEESVTYILANISLKEKKTVTWDAVNEKAIVS